MIAADFEHLIKASIGLDVASIGPSSVERAVQARLVACDLSDRQAYWERVQASDAELQALIEAVVVPETWFFRDREAFVALARIGLDAWLEGSADSPLRLLSLPSSTGEEPYSMAMALLDAGVPPDRFRIDAIDVSAAAIARAERAVYRRNSFRGHDLSFRDRYFDATADGHRLSENVQRQVHFRQGNVFAADFLPGEGIYDAIFCRNLLIYFDRASQDRTVALLERLLRPTGTLFVAPSETGLIMTHDFVSARIPLAFAFLRAPAESCRLTPPAVHAVRPSLTGPPDVRRPAPRQSAQRVTDAEPRPVPQVDTPDDLRSALDEAARLADQGRYVEAAACCEAHLLRHGPTADAFHLLGLIEDAAGKPADASNHYRKALYLDPTHYETLVHFALLVEQQGNRAAAQVMRNRAHRLEQVTRT